MPIVKMSAKILISGDVGGSFAALMKAVSSANAKAGPFEALFVVGTFFAKEGGEHELAPYLSGRLAIPLPTYFIAGDEVAKPPVALPDDGCELCPNLHYLGRQGVTDVAGLAVAYLSGVYKSDTDYATERPPIPIGGYDPCYRQRDVDWLRSKCGRAGAVDLLLTADWPEGFHEMLPGGNPLPDHDSTAPSPPLGKLMEKLAPRYHFAARSHFFLCLPPYQNQEPGGVTRFYGLGAVGNPVRKAKSLQALQVKLRSKLVTAEDRQAQADACSKATPNPYANRGSSKVSAETEHRPFIPALRFAGAKAGYVFKRGDSGLGYYSDLLRSFHGREPQHQTQIRPMMEHEGESIGGTKLFVSGLSWKTVDADLHEVFKEFGQLREARVAVDRSDVDRSRGFGFIEYSEPSATNAALLQMDGFELHGRSINVKRHVEKKRGDWDDVAKRFPGMVGAAAANGDETDSADNDVGAYREDPAVRKRAGPERPDSQQPALRVGKYPKIF